MFTNGYMPSLSDVAAAAGGNRNNGTFGDGNGWWVLIILFALFGGWGNNGYGGRNGGATETAVNADLQRGLDTAAITGQLNSITQGLNTLGYNQLSQINGINQSICNTGYNIQNAIQQQSVAAMQQANALQSQLAQCCCENREATAQVRYDMSTNACAITTAIQQMGQNIMQNCNNNYRELHDELVSVRIQEKDSKIAEQASVIQALNLAASQQAQNSTIINQVVNQVVAQLRNSTGCSGCNSQINAYN